MNIQPEILSLESPGLPALPGDPFDMNGETILNSSIRVLLVDEHKLARRAMAHYLENATDFLSLLACDDLNEVIAMVKQHAPHVVLISTGLHADDAFATAAAIRSVSPKTRPIFLISNITDEHIAQALKAHTGGILEKAIAVLELPRAIQEVANGGTYFSEDVRQRLIIDADGIRLVQRKKSC